MFYWALLLMFFGILFFSLEVFMAGFGICGVLSFFSFLSSFFIIFFYVPYGFFIVLLQIFIIIIAAMILFHIMKKKNMLKKIVLTDNLDFEQKININQYVGKIGITTTMLKPIGFVKFDSDTLEVCSQSGLIAPNTKVKVTEIKNKKIFVERI